MVAAANSMVFYRSGRDARSKRYFRAKNDIANLFEAAAGNQPDPLQPGAAARSNPYVISAHRDWLKFKTDALTGGRALMGSNVSGMLDQLNQEKDPGRAMEQYAILTRMVESNGFAYGGAAPLADLSVGYSSPALVMREIYKPLNRQSPSGTYNAYLDDTEKPFQHLPVGPLGEVKSVMPSAPSVMSYLAQGKGASTPMDMAEFMAANFPPVRQWLRQTENVNEELAYNDELEACLFQANSANYHASNYITLGAGERLGDAGVDFFHMIRTLQRQVRFSDVPTLLLHVMPRPVWEEIVTSPLMLSHLADNNLKVITPELYLALFPECDGLIVSDAVRMIDGTRQYLMKNIFQVVRVPESEMSASELCVHGMNMTWVPPGTEGMDGQHIIQFMDQTKGERGILTFKKTYRSSVHLLAKKAAAAYYTPISPAKMTPPA